LVSGCDMAFFLSAVIDTDLTSKARATNRFATPISLVAMAESAQ
jgi:hypothetical protein